MPFRSFIALFFALIALPAANYRAGHVHGATQAQSRPSGTPDKAQAAKAKDLDNSQEAVVIEQLKTNYRYEKDGTGQREMSIRARIQSEAGVARFGQLIFPYSSANEKLEINFLRVIKPDGRVIAASASDVLDLSAPLAREAPIYTDLRQKHVTVRALRPGDILEYHIVWQVHTAVAPSNFWLNHDFVTRDLIVLEDLLEVDIPRDSKVKLKTEPALEPTIKDDKDRRRYSWKHAYLKREEKDEKEEARNKKDESDGPKPPQVQMTTFQSWDDVGRWYADLERERLVPDEKIRARTEELVGGLKNDKEKIEVLYQYVAKNFRYVSLSLGEGRYQPHAAADVLANQYGDCKDKHTLLASMLMAAGLRAYPALMNSSRKIDPDMPSPGQFDHVISAVPLGSEMLWADTTSEVAPFQLLAPQLRDKKALLIPTGAPARLETTPAEPPFLSTEVVVIEGQVDDLGKLSGHYHLTLRGDAEMLFRIMFRRTPKSDWKELRYYLSMIAGIRGEISKIDASDPAALEAPFEVRYDLVSEDFLDWSSRKAKVSLPIPPLHLADADPGKQEDSKPILLGPPTQVTYRLKLTLPRKYQVRVPLPLKVTRDYADYSSTYRLDGNTLTAERTLRLRQRELPATRFQDYQAFIAAARADEAQTVSFETDIAGSPSIPESVKVEELVSAAEGAAKNQNYPLVEELLKRVLEKEPKHKTARRQLAWALFSQRKFDQASEALREQTKINPFDDYSYNLLGEIYWQQQNYDQAELSFRKQIEVTPLDKLAHSNLGQMMVEWRKYKEAVPELEQGISLNPEEESLYISLGQAYLNLGEKEKAIEAFDKAIKLSPDPLVWNDVAYNLAVSKVQLDKAQRYSESAVTAIATALRNVELEQLTSQDMVRVASIAAYWDTLGWVHFQQGNLDVAEKYIAAAWSMDQQSEVGYHLGQILEKRGKTEEAIHTYALSVVADQLVPEARESLDRLVGEGKSEAFVKKAREELRESRTLKLGLVLKNEKGSVEAQFYVVLAPGASRKAEVADVKFITGDEKLRTTGAAALKAANYNLIFPDETITRIVRRGTLFCLGNAGPCTFIMISPEYVPPVD